VPLLGTTFADSVIQTRQDAPRFTGLAVVLVVLLSALHLERLVQFVIFCILPVIVLEIPNGKNARTNGVAVIVIQTMRTDRGFTSGSSTARKRISTAFQPSYITFVVFMAMYITMNM
jgi:hypothetical protein